MLSVCCINFSTAASQAGGAHRRAPSEKPLFVTGAASAAALSLGCLRALYFSHLTRQLSRIFSRLSPIHPRNNLLSGQQRKGERDGRPDQMH